MPECSRFVPYHCPTASIFLCFKIFKEFLFTIFYVCSMIWSNSQNSRVTFIKQTARLPLSKEWIYITWQNPTATEVAPNFAVLSTLEKNITRQLAHISKNKKPTISSGFKFREILAMTYLPKTKGLSIFGARAFYF